MKAYLAFCNSSFCCRDSQQIPSLGIEKDVPKSADYCPHCNSALMWIKNPGENKKLYRAGKKVKKRPKENWEIFSVAAD